MSNDQPKSASVSAGDTPPAVEQAEPVAIYQSRSPTHWAGWQDITRDDFDSRKTHPPYPVGHHSHEYEYRIVYTLPPASDERLREALEKIGDENNWALGTDEIGKACTWCMDYEHTPNCPVKIALEALKALAAQEPEG